ncbi:MAG: peptidoglycan bridge formation glycyltransferase FemA/FemB family protein, partial [Candidatus Gracilibacteria bacterium]|nr:peptidoglycan bridge formation glycyltransferase FemA/FemB family protein [Candidatus Gracilibacteria bacterium]
KNENCVFVQLEPLENRHCEEVRRGNLKSAFEASVDCHVPRNDEQEDCHAVPLASDESVFKKGYYKNFIEKYTAVIDLTKTEDEILAAMKQKGRYNIRLAEKKGVQVKMVENTEKNLEIYYNLTKETNERDQFNSNSKEYFKKFLDYIYSNNLGGMFFAYLDNEVIAAGIFTFFKKTAIYYYGASTSNNSKRNCMPTYLLQWTAILEAKKRGCKIYDFLGIADPDDKHSHLLGVTDFKLKLSQETKKWPESLIYVNKKLVYRGLKLVKKVKK